MGGQISDFIQTCSGSTEEGAKLTKCGLSSCHLVTISQLYHLRFQYLFAPKGQFVQFAVIWVHLFVHYQWLSVSREFKFYGKVDWGNVVHPLYRGCPFFGGSVIGTSVMLCVAYKLLPIIYMYSIGAL